ncbi:SAM-dependent methlyltransferase [Bradyrhizobium japonicum]|uniref:SAM-dependent methlyltransferase n=1 Tax=Bradyrhizobium japonicum TaxID=375 RepID=A0A0A3Y2D5_BRAJP|nr:class I SAM-dependent methyltransferase [Bradyrhizobium japonicum]KGT79506.1 SAM-dependent methlyltransferase [Bradyrhizobium japonicum]
MSTKKTLPPSYFETKYQADIDPWRFRTSSYEQAKYKATVAALTKPKYQNGLEVGCAIGILSASLAQRCDKLIALDASITAIAEASQQNLPNVRFETAFLPDDFPISAFDLIVLSEVLYYFSEDDLRRLAEKCLEALKGGGEMILCHWLGETDYPHTGHQASDLFAKAVAKRRPTHAVLHEDIYLLERLSFSSSVANDEE